jgi:hypothetical protein
VVTLGGASDTADLGGSSEYSNEDCLRVEEEKGFTRTEKGSDLVGPNGIC